MLIFYELEFGEIRGFPVTIQIFPENWGILGLIILRFFGDIPRNSPNFGDGDKVYLKLNFGDEVGPNNKKD